MVAFLASTRAGTITGTTIRIEVKSPLPSSGGARVLSVIAASGDQAIALVIPGSIVIPVAALRGFAGSSGSTVTRQPWSLTTTSTLEPMAKGASAG